jgi:hypothetical protein
MTVTHRRPPRRMRDAGPDNYADCAHGGAAAARLRVFRKGQPQSERPPPEGRRRCPGRYCPAGPHGRGLTVRTAATAAGRLRRGLHGPGPARPKIRRGRLPFGHHPAPDPLAARRRGR